MKFLVVALAILVVCNAQSDEDWEQFQIKYGKSYRSADEGINRRAVWESNWKVIKQHNEEYARGEHTYTLGENEFADMTFEEFSQQRLGLNPKLLKEVEENKNVHEITGTNPASIDLRDDGIIPAIKNQGSCGSCWAFAAITTVEAAWARANKVSPPNLSEQQLVDCSIGIDDDDEYPYNDGCNGGWLEPTYNDMIQMGIQSQASYPYTGKNGLCKYNPGSVVASIKDKVSIRSEKQLINAVGKGDLVNSAMYASTKFQLYKSGIYNSTTVEDATQVNHAVVCIGYNDAATGGFLLFRNSWGTTWGDKGYFKLQIGKNALNTGRWGVYPVVKKL